MTHALSVSAFPFSFYAASRGREEARNGRKLRQALRQFGRKLRKALLGCQRFAREGWNFEDLPRKVLKMGEQVEMGETLVELSPIEYGRKRLRHEDGDFWELESRSGRFKQFGEIPSSSCGDSSEDVLLDAKFHLDHFGLVSAVLLSDRMVWRCAENEDKLDLSLLCCLGLGGASDPPSQLAVSEIYAVELCEMGRAQHTLAPASLGCSQMHWFAVHSYQRSANQKGTWIPRPYIFGHPDPDVCKTWAQQMLCLLEKEIQRPKNLLVIINPCSGKKMAVKTWEEVAPLFNCAGIRTKVLKTQRTRHAFDVMEKATEAELKELDGVVVVGGDGLFNEVLNGLVLRRHGARYPCKPQDVANKGTDSRDDSQDDKSRLEKRQKEQDLTVLAELNAELDPVSQPASADLHPLLEDPASEKTSSLKSSIASGSTLVPGSKNGDHQTSELTKIMAAVAMSRSVGPDSASMHDAIQFKEGGFVIPSTVETSFNSTDPRIKPGGMHSTSGLVLPNPNFRIGIIPAGSTDSISVSTTGSRNPVTSALHIILGESTPLDVVRLTGWKSRSTAPEEKPRVRYAASFAGYGFYGDVIKESEPNRWMGPMRYDYAGTKVFLEHKLYEAEVSYVELPESVTNPPSFPNHSHTQVTCARKMADQNLNRMICRVNCAVCAKGMDYSNIDENSMSPLPLQKTLRWRSLRGLFLSVGAAVISCRNDKAPNGVAATAHLADGLLHLILIRDCSRPAYLWHLIQLTKQDSNPLDFSFVEHYKTPQFNFISYGEESIWNVDGELFPAHQLSAQVFRGLINIFASGPEV